MGQSFSFADPERVALVIATGRKYVTHAQAMVDCYPSSLLSDADKQHIFRALEERPSTAGMLLLDPHANVRHIQRYLITDLLRYQLKEPNRPHHYRGYAERIPPDAPPVVPPEDAPSSASASAAAPAPSPHGPAEPDRPPDDPLAVAPAAAAASAPAAAEAASSIAEAPVDPAVASPEASSISCAVSSAPVADEADEWTADEELIALLAKKTQ